MRAPIAPDYLDAPPCVECGEPSRFVVHEDPDWMLGEDDPDEAVFYCADHPWEPNGVIIDDPCGPGGKFTEDGLEPLA